MLSVADFDFILPPHLIAQEPRVRGTSRLLVVDRARQSWAEYTVADLPALLAPGDLLVANDTRVFPARLVGRRDPSGGVAECFLLERRSDREWLALVHPGQKLKPGARLIFEDPDRAPGLRIRAVVLSQHHFGRRLVELEVERDAATDLRRGSGREAPARHPGAPATVEDPALHPELPTEHGEALAGDRDPAAEIDDAVDRLGHVPLPPYIHRADEAADRERYQTVYAKARGSVAAPTAGLHFTTDLIGAAQVAGIHWATLTHHVGYGTFKPVRVDAVDAHTVDAETYEIAASAADAIAAARRRGGRVVAVGTTTTRALESAALDGGLVRVGRATTDLFIHPGHPFTVVDALVTNFHLPKSSLLMLVAAMAGVDLTMAAYQYAVEHEFRFYSYGDAMLVI